MKRILMLMFFAAQTAAYGQVIRGRVVEKRTGDPLKFIFVSTRSANNLSDKDGYFTLKISQKDDTLRISNPLYKPAAVAVSNWGIVTRVIMLEENPVALNEVKIRAKRNYIKDSINVRKQFAREFNFSGPAITDILHPSSTHAPFAFVNVDLLSLYSLLSKRKTPQEKLRQQLLRDEQARRIERRYNSTVVGRITGLKGDSLETFMTRYQPSARQLDIMSDYELMQYLKSSMLRFK